MNALVAVGGCLTFLFMVEIFILLWKYSYFSKTDRRIDTLIDNAPSDSVMNVFGYCACVCWRLAGPANGVDRVVTMEKEVTKK